MTDEWLERPYIEEAERSEEEERAHEAGYSSVEEWVEAMEDEKGERDFEKWRDRDLERWERYVDQI